ncbi:MAG: vitamin B12-dependent ribonucleotide reductase [Acidimicrobiales bacterium]|nr:vitamin B12-dependent ribonucleotide reductase [Acidimicrobiales bacterium]
MSIAPERGILGIRRHFTTPGIDPYDEIDWEVRTSRLVDHRDGSVAFQQDDVEVPADWSLNATNILAQKYFRGPLDGPDRESSLRQVADRVAGTIADWGRRDGYFADVDEAEAFAAELRYLVVTQRAAFNSPVWFNIGVPGVPQQASACFILSVEDQMSSILNWYVEEGTIFKGGSGAGVNLSAIRSSREALRGGGQASGPVSFMRGADASAGTIKSGGKTRRAAKMVILDVDHPDVQEFIWCKAREERKVRVLAEAGFDVDFDGADSHSIMYQNANNSVRVTDEFMRAVEADADWDLTAVTDGSVVETVRARDLFRQMSQAAWECADPGFQFDTTINRWHTASNTGRITASNPCAEYVHLDDSACNLASLNLLKFLGASDDDTDAIGGFDIDGFRHAIEVVFTAQEILVGNADYPTEAIGQTTRAFRQLGLGYANLGALLMALGLPYDSDDGRAVAAALTSLMTGHAYRTSARLADRMGAFEGFEHNREPMLGVLDMHREAVELLDAEVAPAVLAAGRTAWFEACALAQRVGVRNSQATVLAPTGTIGLLMDCDTTGIEPDLSLVKHKRLVGGGTMSIVNRTVPRALRRLGYDDEAVGAILAWVDEHQTVVGCPDLRAGHMAVFATSMGDNPIHHTGHIRMMGAIQPFLSGAISKTCNMPETASVDDVEELFLESWRLGLKAVAIYRDNCKVAQPLSAGNGSGAEPAAVIADVAAALDEPVRRKLPRSRRSLTLEFRVADCKGFVTIGEYDDGHPGEIFVRVSKQGSTLAGIMDAFAISLSHGLQYGVPLRAFVDAFTGMRFEPAGMTDDPDLRIATSLIDYLFRRLAVEYLSVEERAELNILTTSERTQPTLPGVEESVTETRQGSDLPADPPTLPSVAQFAAQLALAPSGADAPLCMQCGVAMQRAGSCYVCTDCGATSGCS